MTAAPSREAGTTVAAATSGSAPSCCGTTTAMPAAHAAELATVFKALADPTRLRLVSLVASASAGEACVCDLTEPIGLAQPTVSHHLKVLVDAGILTREQRGRWAYYGLAAQAHTALSAHVDTLLAP
ncbi:ArsR/SmtB family transcription factor [Serinibacter salmoneus]|nr:metalloregulator ArsR/SmtB family transcription factor [Serinibacter salmoneus]